MEQILIVDDLAVIRETISRKLTAEGYACQTAQDGASAIAALETRRFDLILLDITMPGFSGLEVLRFTLTNFPAAAVIMITVTMDVETAVETMKMGACDYIIKPVNLAELPRRVRRGLDLKKANIENQAYQADLENTVVQQDKRLHDSFGNAVKSLALALEAKDPYTGGHSQRVASLVVAIAMELGISAAEQEQLKFAALVHDIGKIGIREAVINKKQDLTVVEYEYITTHAALGAKILAPVIDDPEILNIVRHHHERYDGTGYPDGLTGDTIPRGARILAIADMYDAMTSDRPYRHAVSGETALRELVRQSGTQFDPDIVKAFLNLYSRSSTPLEPNPTSV